VMVGLAKLLAKNDPELRDAYEFSATEVGA
jgi:hypothetical protein